MTGRPSFKLIRDLQRILIAGAIIFAYGASERVGGKMDDKFRVVFLWQGHTPSAAAYAGSEASVFDSLRGAIKYGHEQAEIDGTVAFISYKYLVFEPSMIEVLYKELVADTVKT